MNYSKLKELWKKEEQAAFKGWDFSHLENRWDDEELPFEDNTFDIIINRHESFDVKEVERILKPNGIFITQQVGGKNNEVLSKALIKGFTPLYADNTLDNKLKNLEDNLFEILYANE